MNFGNITDILSFYVWSLGFIGRVLRDEVERIGRGKILKRILVILSYLNLFWMEIFEEFLVKERYDKMCTLG